MNLKNKNQDKRKEEVCVVCEKPIGYFDGFAHMQYRDVRFPLCCDACFETFRNNQEYFFSKYESNKFVNA